MGLRKIISVLSMVAVVSAALSQSPSGKRRMTPVNNPATVTQSVNETRNDTARINEARRAVSTSFVDADGRVVYVDTITGEQWIDSTAVLSKPKMKYPLLHSLSVGVDFWDPVMRVFGQDYGIAGGWVELSLHNRYKPVVEIGLGQARHKPSDGNYTFRSPMSVYFRLGMNYNFLYNSTPDYQFYGGLRYGFSPFSYSITGVSVDSPYWSETARFDMPSQSATAGWVEIVFGLRVKLWGPISAGWSFKYHAILHESKNSYGAPWYIPGYGSRNGALTGSMSVSITLPLGKSGKRRDEVDLETVLPSAAQPVDGGDDAADVAQ